MITAFDDIRARGVADVATILGMSKLGRRGYGPCPSCGALKRHSKHRDKRGAIGVTLNGKGWSCFQCGARGDCVRLVSYAIGHGGRTRGAEGRAVIEEARRRGLVDDVRLPIAQAPHSALSLEPVFPAADELAALMRAARSVDSPGAEPAAAWVHSRGLDPEAVAELCAVAYMAGDVDPPSWAGTSRESWRESGHRLIVPLYDARGVMRSVRARDVTGQARIKELTPTGYRVTGLVMADRKAYRLLKGDAYDGSETMPDHVRRVGAVIAEGTPDWLTVQLSVVAQRGDDAPAVFGIFSGAWTTEHAAKVPTGTAVLIATDRDPQGDDYTAKIAGSFVGRCPCRRWSPKTRTV